jgi:hypothetical protein
VGNDYYNNAAESQFQPQTAAGTNYDNQGYQDGSVATADLEPH